MVFVVLETQANQERQFHTQNCRKDLVNIIILIFVDISFLFQGGGIFFFLDTNSRESPWDPFPCGTLVAFVHSFNQYFGCPLCVKCITLGALELCPLPTCCVLTIPHVKSLGKVGYVLVWADCTLELFGSIKKLILWDMLVQAVFPKI